MSRAPTPSGQPPATRQPLGEQVAAVLLEEIVAGQYLPGDPLPTEDELAACQGVSRLTLREATRILRQKGIIEVRRGQGTFVRPISDWSPLDPVVLGAHARDGTGGLGAMANLLEARRLVEIGVAELAAQRRQMADLEAMEQGLQLMRDAGDQVDQFVEGDLAFHNALLAAARNPVISALFAPLRELLHAGRRATSMLARDRAGAIRCHEAILDAVANRDAPAARAAMAEHLRQTEAGIHRARAREDRSV
jgi:GntR family transcriptional repressor for pyruvate dehydrogenase complex